MELGPGSGLSSRETKFHLAYSTPKGAAIRAVNYRADDGLLMDAFLFSPSHMINEHLTRKLGIVICHGLRDTGMGSVPSAIGQLLAKCGHTVLSINKRNSSVNWEQSIFEDTSRDIKGSIEYLRSIGFSQVFLIGHSLGCTELLYHLAHEQESIVRGLVMLAAPSDIKGKSTISYFKRFLDPRRAYKKMLKKAETMVRNNQGDDLLDLVIDLPGNYMHVPTSAKTFLSYRSPKSNCSAKLWIGCVNVPILLVGHETDWTTKEDNEELLSLVNRNTSCDFVLLENANHYLEGHYERVAQIVDDWISKISVSSNRHRKGKAVS